jgi:ribonuclease Z
MCCWTLQAPFTAKQQLAWSIPCRFANVKAAQMQHRIPCWGYVFNERTQEQQEQQQQQPGISHSSNGVQGHRHNSPPTAAGPQPGSRRVVVLGDTMNSRAIVPWALGAHVMAHEATFAGGMEATAFKAQHSTAWMAGQFARIIGVQLLVLTHFSARYPHKHTTKPHGGGSSREGGGRGGRGQQPEEDMSEEASGRTLYQEAADAFGSNSVLLARDLFTVHVPRPDAQQGESAAPTAAVSIPAEAAAGGGRSVATVGSSDEAPRQEAGALLASLAKRQAVLQQPSTRRPRSRQ